jgi:hypothetical protein
MEARLRQFLLLGGVSVLAYFMPVEQSRFRTALVEALAMLHEYAREHVLLCLVAALFIAGAIAVFVSKAAGIILIVIGLYFLWTA